MFINHQKPSHRKYHRLNTPLNIAINGHVYPPVDWCIAGFSIDDWQDTSLNIGDKVKCYFKLPFQGFDIGFSTEAEIVRLDRAKKLMAANFLDLNERQKNILQHFAEELVRGSMANINDTIARIDTPFTPVTEVLDASPLDDMPIERWKLKNIINVTAYILFGFALIFYIVFTFYTNFFKLEVSSAVVISELEKIYAPIDGRVLDVEENPEKLIEKNQLLIRIDNAELEEKIAMAKLKVSKMEVLFQSKMKALDIETRKMRDYANFAQISLDQSKEDASSARLLVKLANTEVKRLKHLQQMKMSSQQELDRAMSNLTLAYNKLKKSLVKQHQKKETVSLIDRGYFFTGEKLLGNLNELQLEVSRVREEINIARDELSILINQQRRMIINSPGVGRFIQLIKQKGSAVKSGDLVGIFEYDTPRKVDVYLTQEEVLGVKQGALVKVFFPSINRLVDGEVIHIDRTGYSNEEDKSEFTWIPAERTVRTSLKIKSLSNNEIREILPHGLPAIVSFSNLKSGFVGRFFRSLALNTGTK